MNRKIFISCVRGWQIARVAQALAEEPALAQFADQDGRLACITPKEKLATLFETKRT